MVVFMAPLMASRTFSLLSSKPMSFSSLNFLKKHLLISVPFSCSTRYPLQYELIAFHPVRSPVSASQRPRAHRPYGPENLPEKETIGSPELGSQEKDSDRTRFEEWVDKKLSARKMEIPNMGKPSGLEKMDKSKRKYYKKRMKRMYGSDSDDERGKEKDGYVELQPEVVDLPTLHAREEELYFYDAFAYPWEKEKHYRMVYQLEKKYFPDQCLDKAFVEPGESVKVKEGKNLKKSREKKEKLDVGRRQNGEGGDIDKRLVFFEEENGERGRSSVKSNESVSEKKVQEFFKCLKQMPKVEEDPGEPYILTTKTELPSRWDGPFGTVVLVNKPKGWTSFTVCGKLRRLVKVQKVGHAGTLDPMATGLLIVCVGKATKQVERFQDMIKGYSGIFRLGEATSTWDADSPVIQREPWEHIKDMDIKKAAASFHGEIWQVPPMFSAIKVGGEKMYEKARRGESIELSPRRISIFQFDIERSLDDRQNLIFRVTCSKGTYIRSLCADFGKLLGSCAHLTALRRDSIGQFSADDAWDFQELEDQVTKSYL